MRLKESLLTGDRKRRYFVQTGNDDLNRGVRYALLDLPHFPAVERHRRGVRRIVGEHHHVHGRDVHLLRLVLPGAKQPVADHLEDLVQHAKSVVLRRSSQVEHDELGHGLDALAQHVEHILLLHELAHHGTARGGQVLAHGCLADVADWFSPPLNHGGGRDTIWRRSRCQSRNAHFAISSTYV